MYRHVYVSDVPVILYTKDTIENKFRLPKLIPLLEKTDKRSQNEGFFLKWVNGASKKSFWVVYIIERSINKFTIQLPVSYGGRYFLLDLKGVTGHFDTSFHGLYR